MQNKNHYKIAIISPVPFYYHASFYRRLANSSKVDLTVYYSSKESIVGEDVKKEYGATGRFPDEDMLMGYSYKFIKNYSPCPSYLTWPFGLINLGVWREIKNGKYDAVILQAWTNMTWWIAFLACLKFKTPVLFMTDANILSESSNKLKKALKTVMLRFLSKNATGFLIAGEANKQLYLHYGASEKKIIPMHFSWGYEYFLDEYKRLKPEREKIRASFGIKKEDFVFLFVGRLVEEKKLFNLLDAYARNKANSHKKLFFVGGGPLLGQMEKYIKDLDIKGVHFVGFQSRKKLSNFYALADALVLPSRWEPWGMVVNEAMCFGLPVIVSDKVGAYPDLVLNNQNGFVFQAEDTDQLATSIEKMINLSEKEYTSFQNKSIGIIKEWVGKIDPVEQLVRFFSGLGNDINFSRNRDKRILMISPHVPWPLYGGPAVRIFNLIKEFYERGYKITLLAGSKDERLSIDNPLNKICNEVRPYKLPVHNKLFFIIKSFFSSKPYPALRFQSDSLITQLNSLLKEREFDLVWVNFSILADILPYDVIGDIPIVLDQHECEEAVFKDYFHNGSIIERFSAFINLIRLERFHKKFLSMFNVILCASKEEADFTQTQVDKNVKILVVPNGVDDKFFTSKSDSKNKPNSIILCGNMGVRRNVDAAVWFATKIFPEIRNKISDAEFYLVGSSPTQEILQLNSIPGVHVIGEVKDIREYYRMGKVFVAPYRIGAGAKLKIFEAMASDIPIVCTAIACRGVEVVNGQHVLIADNEVDFSRCVVDLLKNYNLSQKLAKNSLALIKEKYYWKNIVDGLEPKILKAIKKNDPN